MQVFFAVVGAAEGYAYGGSPRRQNHDTLLFPIARPVQHATSFRSGTGATGLTGNGSCVVSTRDRMLWRCMLVVRYEVEQLFSFSMGKAIDQNTRGRWGAREIT